MNMMKLSHLDKAINYIAPTWGVKRQKAKMQIAASSSFSGYINGSSPHRSMQGIDVSSNEPDADTIQKLDGSRALSRSMIMQNAIAKSALDKIRTNTVGSGLRLQVRLDKDFLKLSDKEAEDWKNNVEHEFNVWANSKDCDLTRTQNFYELQDLIFYSVLLSGDVSVVFPHKKIKTSQYKTKIKVIESDLLSTPDDIHNTKRSFDTTTKKHIKCFALT